MLVGNNIQILVGCRLQATATIASAVIALRPQHRQAYTYKVPDKAAIATTCRQLIACAVASENTQQSLERAVIYVCSTASESS